MSKGDTTIRIDMEVAGASSAKMTAKDVYQSIESASKKATNTEEAEMKKRANAAKSLAKQKEKYLKQNQAQEYRDWLKNEQKKIESVGLLQAQRSRYVIANTHAEEQEKRRLARETAAETKRIAREHERDSKRRMREEARDAKMLAKQRGMMGGLLGRGLWAGAMGIAGYAGVAGVSSIIGSVSSASADSEKKQADLERDLTPTVAIGDNVNKMKEMRTEVVGLGAYLGKTNQEVASFLEGLGSLSGTMAAEKLAEIKKESMELSEFSGGDMKENMRMMAKTQISFGDSFGTMNQLQNKMYQVQVATDATMSEFSQRWPDLLAAGKAVGLTVDEIAAAAVAATVAGGTAEKSFTGAKTSFIALEKAQEKGIKLTGTLVDKLEQVQVAAAQGKISLLEIFQGEGLVAGTSIVYQLEKVKQNIEAFQSIGQDQDVVGENLKKKFSDPQYAQARIYDLDKALIENGPNLAVNSGEDTFMTRLNERWRLGQHAGNQRGYGEWMMGSWVTGLLAALGNDTLLEEGQQVRLAQTPEGSAIRNELLKKQFEQQKERDIERLKVGAGWYSPGIAPGPLDAEKLKEIQNRQFVPEKADAAQPSLEKSIQIASGIDELNKNQRETNRLLSNMQPSGNGLKPGGSKANAEETL